MVSEDEPHRQGRRAAHASNRRPCQVPVLQYRGHVLTESSIINEFLDETFPDVRLMPRSALDRAKAREAIDYCTFKLMPLFYHLVSQRTRAARSHPAAHAHGAARGRRQACVCVARRRQAAARRLRRAVLVRRAVHAGRHCLLPVPRPVRRAPGHSLSIRSTTQSIISFIRSYVRRSLPQPGDAAVLWRFYLAGRRAAAAAGVACSHPCAPLRAADRVLRQGSCRHPRGARPAASTAPSHALQVYAAFLNSLAALGAK